MTEEAEPVVKYAMELSGLDIGSRVTWIHKYNYKGEQREKLKEISNVYSVFNKPKSVTVQFKKPYKTYWGETIYQTNQEAIKPDVLVAVYEE